jgi:DNA-binding transcriptional LysR family regulator
LGVSFVAESNCQEEVKSGRLIALPLAPEPVVRQIGLVYRRDKALSRVALGFIDVVLEHTAKGGLAPVGGPAEPAVGS